MGIYPVINIFPLGNLPRCFDFHDVFTSRFYVIPSPSVISAASLATTMVAIVTMATTTARPWPGHRAVGERYTEKWIDMLSRHGRRKKNSPSLA